MSGGFDILMSDFNPFILEGIVLETSDPDQMGRIKVWIPSVDGEYYQKDQLPWCEYASPLAGFTSDFKRGRQNLTTSGLTSYGFWAIPKIGAMVLCFFLNGDPNRRFFFAQYFNVHQNRSLPDGRNVNPDTGDVGCFTDDYGIMRPEMDNLNQQFAGDLKSPQAKTRGVWERQVAQDKTEKDGHDGYAQATADDYLDPQTYCLVTPGRHGLIMQDAPDSCRVRLKTTEGNQIILDDTNERIYISTARGGAWLEMDEDGHVHLFGTESVSIRAGKDINLIADNNVNIEAKNNVNIKAVNGTMVLASKGDMTLTSTGANVYTTACSELHMLSKSTAYLTGNGMNITTSGSMFITPGRLDVKSTGPVTITGKPSNVNGPTAMAGSDAQCGKDAGNPSVVPSHEPWKRPASLIKRNKYWSE